MNSIRLFDELEGCQKVLLAGAGGGFDIFCGLPLFFALQDMGKEVHLANLSFSNLQVAEGEWIGPAILTVTADSLGSKEYFPEKYLCDWFESTGQSQSIYCIDRTGYIDTFKSYQLLAEQLELDAIVLVDGGTDSLMRGDEPGLGTPQEDILSIACVNALDVKVKALVCLGFGIDTFHGVCHAHCLEAIAALSRKDAYWGAFSIHPEMSAVKRYMDASYFVFDKMPNNKSIVNASILSALEGEYGDYHKTTRTAGSELWINPLMSLYWSFQLDAIADRNLYLDTIKSTRDYHEVTFVIRAFRSSLRRVRDWKSIPI